MNNFTFYDDVREAYDSDGFLYADIPKGVNQEDGLINCYKQLRWIAPYFGGNINSLDECLRDVTFYPDAKNKIVHHDIPTIIRGDWVGNYISILDRAIQYLALHRELKNKTEPPYAAELNVFFPKNCEVKVTELLNKFGSGNIRERIMDDEDEKQAIIHWGEDSINSGEWKKWRLDVGL
jgi:hypothetical protein